MCSSVSGATRALDVRFAAAKVTSNFEVVIESLFEAVRVPLRNSARGWLAILACQQIHHHSFQHRHGNTILLMIRRLQFVCHRLNFGGRKVQSAVWETHYSQVCYHGIVIILVEISLVFVRSHAVSPSQAFQILIQNQ
jgi:hypothetical protein